MGFERVASFDADPIQSAISSAAQIAMSGVSLAGTGLRRRRIGDAEIRQSK